MFFFLCTTMPKACGFWQICTFPAQFVDNYVKKELESTVRHV